MPTLILLTLLMDQSQANDCVCVSLAHSEISLHFGQTRGDRLAEYVHLVPQNITPTINSNRCNADMPVI